VKRTPLDELDISANTQVLLSVMIRLAWIEYELSELGSIVTSQITKEL